MEENLIAILGTGGGAGAILIYVAKLLLGVTTRLTRIEAKLDHRAEIFDKIDSRLTHIEAEQNRARAERAAIQMRLKMMNKKITGPLPKNETTNGGS